MTLHLIHTVKRVLLTNPSVDSHPFPVSGSKAPSGRYDSVDATACPSSRFFISRLPAALQFAVVLAGALLLGGCEAPLVLDGVEQQKQATTLRFDQLQAATHIGDVVTVVGSRGVVLTSADGGKTFSRQILDGRPSLIAVTECGDNGFAALDINRSVWTSDARGQQWNPFVLSTQETPLAIDCSSDGTLWVAGSFSTLLSSKDGGKSWSETSLQEDLMFTAVQFLDANTGFALGEYGTVARTDDGGANWAMLEPLPNEFYPLSALFVSADQGWVTGLNGGVLATRDGGASWNRAETPTIAPLYGLASSGSNVYAVGDHGSLIVSNDGIAWHKAAANTETLSYLRGITALGEQLVVAGGGGVLSRINPESKQAALGGHIGVTP